MSHPHEIVVCSIAVVRPGYRNFYVYSAACPGTGEDVTPVLPRAGTDTTDLSLAHMARRMGGRGCVLAMDRADRHVSGKPRVPRNIGIVPLPPCSPGLNSVEKLWQWPERHMMRDRLFLRLEEVMDVVGGRLKTPTADFFRGICRCGYLLH